MKEATETSFPQLRKSSEATQEALLTAQATSSTRVSLECKEAIMFAEA